MKKFAMIGAHQPPRTGCIAIMCGALLGTIGAAGPAQSADFYPHEYTAYGQGYNGYYRNCPCCYPCGCRPCCYPCGCHPCVRRGPVVERHWDYWERRYPSPYPYRYPYYPSGYAGGYPDYPNGYAGDYPYYRGGYTSYPAVSGWEGPRPHLRFGGIQHPRSPISYDYEGPRSPYEYDGPRSPYEYEGPRGPYEYEAAPRPPLGIPGGYRNAGYLE